MKDRPVLFNGDMVRAILDGRKTQTRRLLKVQPCDVFNNGNWYADRYNKTEDWCFWGKKGTDVHNKCGLPLFKCPYGKVGDRLWVRETWACASELDDVQLRYYAYPIKNVWYRADDKHQFEKHGACKSDHCGKWRPSIFMKREHSRITLEITNIRVERLNDITSQDALAEGVEKTQFWTPQEMNNRPFEEKWWDDFHFFTNYPQIVFKKLWESINGAGSWDLNPWVWVIEFKKLKFI